jgi:thioredoxin-dependent peroxiredoxin
MIQVGDIAPDFTGQASDGSTFKLSQRRGKLVVLYFYPKSFTPGCTLETKNFRDHYDEVRELGAEVVGVSCDNVETQCDFAGRHGVKFPLVGDADRGISRSYGVLWPLLNRDKRVTLIIDEQGRVAAIFRHELQVRRHLEDVLEFLKNRRVGKSTTTSL